MVDESGFKTVAGGNPPGSGGEAPLKTRDRAAHFVDDVREKAGPLIESAREKLAEKAHVLKEKLSEGADQMKKKSLSDLGTDINRYVRNNPGKVVLGALAVGMVLGAVLRGRNRA